MKILWLRPSKGDNISVRRERIASELRLKGYEVDIQDASRLDLLPAIRRTVTGNYDVIAGNVRIGLYVGYLLARLLRKPFLGDVSDPISDIDSLPSPVFRFFEWYEWQVLSRADTAVFVYESSYQKAISLGISSATKLPNAVDFEFFSNPELDAVNQSREILKTAGVGFDKPIAIYLGFFGEHYKIRDIIAAAEQTPQWDFVFVGENGLESDVINAANSLDNVYYPGAHPYELMPGFLSHADVGFCFKDAEQPLKLKEYAAAGIPVIARPGKLSTWYADDELVFVEPNGAAISEALVELQDHSVAQRYTENLLAAVDDRTWEDIADAYDRIFKRIATTIK